MRICRDILGSYGTPGYFWIEGWGLWIKVSGVGIRARCSMQTGPNQREKKMEN